MQSNAISQATIRIVLALPEANGLTISHECFPTNYDYKPATNAELF